MNTDTSVAKSMIMISRTSMELFDFIDNRLHSAEDIKVVDSVERYLEYFVPALALYFKEYTVIDCSKVDYHALALHFILHVQIDEYIVLNAM